MGKDKLHGLVESGYQLQWGMINECFENGTSCSFPIHTAFFGGGLKFDINERLSAEATAGALMGTADSAKTETMLDKTVGHDFNLMYWGVYLDAFKLSFKLFKNGGHSFLANAGLGASYRSGKLNWNRQPEKKTDLAERVIDVNNLSTYAMAGLSYRWEALQVSGNWTPTITPDFLASPVQEKWQESFELSDLASFRAYLTYEF